MKELFGHNGVTWCNPGLKAFQFVFQLVLQSSHFFIQKSQSNSRVWQVFLTAGIIVADVVGAGILAMPVVVGLLGLILEIMGDENRRRN